jgi:hypothetical protein
MGVGKVRVMDCGRPCFHTYQSYQRRVPHEMGWTMFRDARESGGGGPTFVELQQVSWLPSVRYFLPTDLSSVEETL